MAETPAEYTMLAQLIAAHESALEQAAMLRADPNTESATNASPAPDGAAGPKRDKTTSGDLLRRAVAALGIEPIATALSVEPAALAEFMGSGRTMTLAQQRMFAVALITLTEAHPNLRRRAIGLLGQVRAAEDFQAGITRRHLDTPPRNYDWR